ncbi:cysteine hydrolase family protein [Sphaerisporangium perillae]|uniref:cysteine hydrolase family protein n=1 Tax=Sphaerisporangium perillae TaxID=2935860 RepID=UPI00200D4B0C|nr:cysteine hydrolase family protein [Sphaerisporangium perillae]
MTTAPLQLAARYYRTFPVEAPLGHTEETLDLDPRRTAFLLVDVNGLGFDRDEPAPSPDLPALYADQAKASRGIVVDHIVPAKQAAVRAGIPIVYLSNHLSPTLNERSEWRNMSLRVHNIDVLQSWQEPNDILAYSDVVAPRPGEYLVKKQLYSGFFETQLDSLLRSLDIYNLVTVGFDSRICLHTTVIDAMYRNYRVIALRDAIGTSPLANGDDAETGDGKWADANAVRFIETNVGYTATSEQWVAACDAHTTGTSA